MQICDDFINRPSHFTDQPVCAHCLHSYRAFFS
jgi:hypothetical protein